MNEQAIRLIWTALGIFTGFVAYYLKKRDGKIEENEKEIKKIENTYLTKAEFEKSGIDDIKRRYVGKDELEKVEEVLEKKIQKTEEDLQNAIQQNNSKIMDKLEKLDDKISSLNKDHIDKEEFLRFNSRIEDKIDKIQEMVITVRKEQTEVGQR